MHELTKLFVFGYVCGVSNGVLVVLPRGIRAALSSRSRSGRAQHMWAGRYGYHDGCLQPGSRTSHDPVHSTSIVARVTFGV